MRVRVRGTTYESVKDCAAALGVSPKTVYTAVNYGNPDKIGTGRPRPPGSGNQNIDNSKPVTIAGKHFPSISALARFLGRDISCTRKALNTNGRAARAITEAVARTITTPSLRPSGSTLRGNHHE